VANKKVSPNFYWPSPVGPLQQSFSWMKPIVTPLAPLHPCPGLRYVPSNLSICASKRSGLKQTASINILHMLEHLIKFSFIDNHLRRPRVSTWAFCFSCFS